MLLASIHTSCVCLHVGGCLSEYTSMLFAGAYACIQHLCGCIREWEEAISKAAHVRPLPAHFLQMTTPRLTDAHSGCGARQSAQLLLASLNQIFSATS